ncbi:MAG: hypothetical protein ACOC8E_03425 [Planctomycetota bacterium]
MSDPAQSVLPRWRGFNLTGMFSADQEGRDAFCLRWSLFAGRYRGIPSRELSFDLVNEPPAPSDKGMRRADQERVVRAAVSYEEWQGHRLDRKLLDLLDEF